MAPRGRKGQCKEYLVEAIAGVQYNFDKKREEYWVKWRGYKRLTWEPRSNVQDLSLFTDDLSEMGRKLWQMYNEEE